MNADQPPRQAPLPDRTANSTSASSLLTQPVPAPAPDLGVHAELLSRIWRQSLPLIEQRVASLEQAAMLIVNGNLAPAARTDAADLAHKLAGSLGMFGYPRGTEIAREMEQLFEAEESPNAARLATLAAELRAALPLDSPQLVPVAAST